MWLGEGALFVIGLDQRGGMHLVGWFPCVVCVRVPIPFEEILQGLLSPVEAVINDGLDFVLVFPLDQFGGGLM
jgi:hypothetical protein